LRIFLGVDLTFIGILTRQSKTARQLARIAGVVGGEWLRSGRGPTNRHSPTLPNIEERMKPLTYRIRPGRPVGVMLILAAGASLAGCGVVAAPIRATSSVVSVVPVAGPIAAAPLDVTANTID
jgi:hypothetical protein